jgi:hypothetical protein
MVKARKQAEYHWDKGDLSWSPPPPKKQEGKRVKETESLIERLQRQKREKEKLIDMM